MTLAPFSARDNVSDCKGRLLTISAGSRMDDLNRSPNNATASTTFLRHGLLVIVSRDRSLGPTCSPSSSKLAANCCFGGSFQTLLTNYTYQSNLMLATVARLEATYIPFISTL